MEGNGGGGQPGAAREAELLLKESERFLRSRNFDGSRKSALRILESDPTNTDASQILAVVDVLSAAAGTFSDEPMNWNGILRLKNHPSSEGLEIIRTRFDNLSLLLNPDKNKFAFAREAFELVQTAWLVLSHPFMDAQVGNEFTAFKSESNMEGQCESGSVDGTIWTMCPYCYYVYEYPRVYVECCLRCQNKNCGKAFQAVAIHSPPPPAAANCGYYLCPGFYPVALEERGEAKGYPCWTPFGPTSKGTGKEEGEEKTAIPKGNNGSNVNFVEISDDSDNSGSDELMGENNGENLQTEELKSRDLMTDGCGINSHQIHVPSVVKPVLKWKKSVAKSTKKVMGKGIRIKIPKNVSGNSERARFAF